MIPQPRIQKARRPLALLLCLALAECDDAPLPPQASGSYPLFADASFAPPSERLSVADVFEVSPEMRAFLDTRVAELADQRGEARGLVEAWFTDRRVKVDYDAWFKRTAVQAFAAHAGNCMSLAIVTGAMAKALGLDARYQFRRDDRALGARRRPARAGGARQRHGRPAGGQGAGVESRSRSVDGRLHGRSRPAPPRDRTDHGVTRRRARS